MNKLELAVLRRAATPAVASDAPGELTLRFGVIRLLPAAVQPYVGRIKEAAAMLPGVTETSMNAATGELRIAYDPAQTDGKTVRRWMDTVVETCLGLAGSPELSRDGLTVEEIAAVVRDTLEQRLRTFSA